MRMLMIVYDVDFDDDIMAMLDNLSVSGYTKWDRVLGKGKRSQPKLDNAVWPGYNSAVVLVAEDETEDEIFAALKDLFNRIGGHGFAVFELPVLRVV